MIKTILLLGDPALYKKSVPVSFGETDFIKETVDNLHDTLMEFRRKYKRGRAIAAPQIGVFKRLIYMNTGEPVVFINPVLEFSCEKKMTVLDDCMSFPGLYVEVERYISCSVKYLDLDWKENEIRFDGDLSELIQHEYDHLDGILATMRAINNKSLSLINNEVRYRCHFSQGKAAPTTHTGSSLLGDANEALGKMPGR